MEEKKCPVDRGKLLIGLECCRFERGEKCMACPYYESHCDLKLIEDASSYIGWLEEQLGVTGLSRGKSPRFPRGSTSSISG